MADLLNKTICYCSEQVSNTGECMVKALKILTVLVAVIAAGSALIWAFRIPIINSVVEVVIDDIGIANASVQIAELDLSSATLSEV